MPIASIPQKLLIFSLVFFSITADAQRPRWSSQAYALIGSPLKVVVADVNGDGHSDLVISIPSVPDVAVLLGNGDGTFQSPRYSPYDGGDIAVADLTGDQKADLATPQRLYSGSWDGYFHFTSLLPKSGVRVLAGDFNKDGKTDLVVYDLPDVSPIDQWTLLGNGSGGFTPTAEYLSVNQYYGSGPWFATDLNGDGKLDLVFQMANKVEGPWEQDPYSYVVETGKGNGGFNAPVGGDPSFGDTLVGSIGLGDVNGDKKMDLVIAGADYASGALQVHTYLGKGNGTFKPFVTAKINCNGPFAMGDLNGDGRSDLLCDLNGKETFYSSNGNGSYTKGTVFTASATTGIVIADLNNDGSRDAILLDTGSSVTVLLNLSGTSTKLTSSSNPSTHGHAVTFTATAAHQSTGVPTGKISFKNGSTVLATVTMSSGKATYTTTSLSVGTHSVTATYTGDGNFNGSTSAVLSQKVN